MRKMQTACNDMVVESNDVDIDKEKVETTEVVENVNNVVVVHAIATFENSPDLTLFMVPIFLLALCLLQ